jgi:hypothetical protein
MKAKFKPLALASAVAAASVGYAGVTQAQTATFAGNALGDAAIIPYYSVQEGFVSGIHIINTDKDNTVVVKIRYRRAKDSMDALDFNLVMSPLDEWTGHIRRQPGVNGDTISVKTNDNTCTVPALIDGVAPMGDLFREGAEEGYIEVIAMASIPAKASAIGIASLHATSGPTHGIPVDCKSVESNFFRQAQLNPKPIPAGPKGLDINGVYSSSQTVQDCSDAVLGIMNPASQGCTITNSGNSFLNTFNDAGNVLKVSYFIRDEESGLEFGSNAYHIRDLNDQPMMSNQERIIVNEKDYYSFLYPDLDGGSPAPAEDNRGKFNDVRTAMGSSAIINDWSVNAATNTATDWVITLPGQYLMLNLPVYVDFDAGEIENCFNKGQAEKANNKLDEDELFSVCDARDIPVEVFIGFSDREEQVIVGPDDGLVISPETTDRPASLLLEWEVNVIEWTDGSLEPILGSEFATNIEIASDKLTTPNGWATLFVKSDTTPGKVLGIVDYTQVGGLDPAQDPFNYDVAGEIPIVGFVAWQRSFPEDPSANYGRLIEHSFVSS